MQEVRGSIPLSSTKFDTEIRRKSGREPRGPLGSLCKRARQGRAPTQHAVGSALCFPDGSAACFGAAPRGLNEKPALVGLATVARRWRSARAKPLVLVATLEVLAPVAVGRHTVNQRIGLEIIQRGLHESSRAFSVEL
jgi:hypothetical protein